MKLPIPSFFSSLPLGARLLIALYALGFPVAKLGHYAHTFELYDWLALAPAVVWRGEIWCLVTHAFLAGGVVDWVVSIFWLATLVSILGRHWRARELWVYCLLTTLVSALIIVVAMPRLQMGVVGNGAMILGLLAAWYRLYGHERLILLGFGEVSVRQAATLVALVELLLLFFAYGPIITAAMLLGGAAGWIYLVLKGKHELNRRSQTMNSERIARIEL